VGGHGQRPPNAAREQTPVIVILNGDQLERLRAPGDVVVQLRRSHFQTCPDADSWRRA
jgi:hypothetical protein